MCIRKIPASLRSRWVITDRWSPTPCIRNSSSGRVKNDIINSANLPPQIDHLHYQVHLYDLREGGFKHRPWLEFGYRALAPKANRGRTSAGASASTSRSASSSSIPKVGSRYTRGSATNSLFARGYGDGVVLVWDYRNGAQKVRGFDLPVAAAAVSPSLGAPPSRTGTTRPPPVYRSHADSPPWWHGPSLQEVLERFQFERPAEVAHTVLVGSDVIAYGGYSVTFWSMLAAKP